ncbi:MAG: bifunctional adenosylcobinamide kinase/adenosylcobinamide-phosphate guanylyltransferase [Candidatus Jettenia sp.]|uniref:Adenosylcobinamide kinase n=1 Tax=Candidatus Jettenia caeni TaxID=247490 RepID=I3IMA1_9BACT|nr:bifunctional adenosylcobinamide kinase/adenosylcobinamide-phosphate guanylyltransferase [Candidatus Jettenia sp. AMX1]MBC6927726.1 bifunctional adenosylcobinamide kinase/adenosylcobinamide-phosphate guanylyltransferase [Candidatus Jettenia sp.]NUN22072.1 bifunctional adenosylcobinamide kinase/adenosylcobinamide-phosphate guanylyltransferase [Candidatus Jettenia caeni]KAA0251412.1 MAG: bifunctional adenosylcobinamide kinase/adenosylcobinamide-phosphate guanylyltransferase [Candidatus Jettenia 
MAKITFVLGGARSGKSAFAEGLAKRYHDVVYIATAEVKDDEMRERIQTHRARRPSHWKTVESPYHIDRAISDIQGNANLVLIDCITLYITNMLLCDEIANSVSYPETDMEHLKQKQVQILDEINKLSKACRKSKSDSIVVSNEVGLGIVPDNPLSRLFRDIAGRANQIIADEADEVYFMVAGIPQRLK